MTPDVMIHAGAGALGLVSGVVAVVASKGERLHGSTTHSKELPESVPAMSASKEVVGHGCLVVLWLYLSIGCAMCLIVKPTSSSEPPAYALTAERTATIDVGDAIRKQEAAMKAAVAAKDAAAVAAFYAQDAQMFSPGVAHTTPSAIRAAFEAMFDDPNGSLRFQNDTLVIPLSGDYVVSQGTFVASYTDPASHQRASQSGNFINVWRRLDNGSWRIMRDMTAPAPDTPPSR